MSVANREMDRENMDIDIWTYYRESEREIETERENKTENRQIHNESM